MFTSNPSDATSAQKPVPVCSKGQNVAVVQTRIHNTEFGSNQSAIISGAFIFSWLALACPQEAEGGRCLCATAVSQVRESTVVTPPRGSFLLSTQVFLVLHYSVGSKFRPIFVSHLARENPITHTLSLPPPRRNASHINHFLPSHIFYKNDQIPTQPKKILSDFWIVQVLSFVGWCSLF